MIIEQQRRRGWQTHHITSARQPNPNGAYETIGDLGFYRTPPTLGILGRLPVIEPLSLILGLQQRLEDVIDEVSPDVVHAHSPCLNGVAAVRAARRHSLPCVYEVRAFWEDAAVDHGTTRAGSVRYRLSRMIENYVLRRADAVTTICDGLRKAIKRRKVTRGNVTVIPNAVDFDTLSEDAAKDSELLKAIGLQGKTVLGFLGSFYHYEGLKLLFDAVNKLERTDDLAVLLVGGGPEDSRLRRRAKSARVPIVFTGRVPLQEVDRYYNLIDVCVYPRLPMRLTDLVTPLKPLEAMAKRRLVVASDVGGHQELIAHGATGFLFKAGNATALAQCLNQTLENLDGLDHIRRAAFEFVRTERTWKRSVARYEQVYAEALASALSEHPRGQHGKAYS